LKANKDAIARQADHNTELIEAMKQMAAVNAALLEQQKASFIQGNQKNPLQPNRISGVHV
jgi:hypothetical protein